MRGILITVIFLQFFSWIECKKVILVSLDGFRHDYIEMAKSKGKNVSAFEEIARRGFQAKVENVMSTNTFPTHFSIATGRYVENHGLMGNTFWDPRLNRMYSYRNQVDQLDSNWLEYENNEPIWLTNQRHGSRSGLFYWPGSQQPYKGKYPFATYGIYNDNPDFKYRVKRIMDWIVRDEFNFCVLYFPQPDSTGHKLGPSSPEMLVTIEEVNAGIGYLLERIDADPRVKGIVNLIVTADHGMADVGPKNDVNLYERIDASNYIANLSPGVVGIFPNGTMKLEEMVTALNNPAPLPHLSVYTKENMPESYHYGNSYRSPPLLLVAETGYIIKTEANSYATNRPGGMHGYDNSDPLMHPFLVAFGPEVKKQSGIQNMKQIDIYVYICGILGLQYPNKVDGSFDRIRQFLQNPPTEAWIKEFNEYATGNKKPDLK